MRFSTRITITMPYRQQCHSSHSEVNIQTFMICVNKCNFKQHLKNQYCNIPKTNRRLVSVTRHTVCYGIQYFLDWMLWLKKTFNCYSGSVLVPIFFTTLGNWWLCGLICSPVHAAHDYRKGWVQLPVMLEKMYHAA